MTTCVILIPAASKLIWGAEASTKVLTPRKKVRKNLSPNTS